MKIIFLSALPILLMVGLLAIIQSELARLAAFIIIVGVTFLITKAGKKEILLFAFGFIMMSFFEYIFVSTKVETFTQQTYLGVMPLWLPVLWGYGFVAISKGVKVIESKI